MGKFRTNQNQSIQAVKACLIVVALFAVVSMGQKLDVPVFELDAVSAATDGSECTTPSWVGCSVGWLEKGYVFDQAKGYYVPGGGSTTTKAPAVTSTTAKTTTGTSNQATSGTSSTTIAPKDTATSSVTSAITLSPVNQAPSATKATYTNRPRETVVTTSTSKIKVKASSSTFPIPIEWLGVGIGALLVMTIEFFVVRAIYKR